MHTLTASFISRFIFFSILLCSLFSIITLSEARWATYEDAPAEMEFFSRDITCDLQGKSQEIVEQQVKILNERGRDQFGTQTLFYNSSLEEIQIIEAKSIYQGKEFKVSKDMIEIKPVASQTTAFDEVYQVLVSYPQAQPGAQLYLKYKIITRKRPIPKSYNIQLVFGQEAYWNKAVVTLKSELPVKIMSNDPQQCLEITEGKDKNYQTVKVTLKKPVYNAAVNEPRTSIIPWELQTWVSASSFTSNEEVARGFTKGFEDVIGKPLPPLLVAIKEEATKLKDTSPQINQVTSLLAEKIRYMGDWRTVEGKFAPRPLATTADSGYGDCKDFAAATVAILRSLGYKAHIALVMRGQVYLAPTKSQPDPANYNHAIVRVEDGNGKVYWIDPTNIASMADGIFPDIADRPALVLNPNRPTVEMIPAIDSNHACLENNCTISIKEDETLMTEGTLMLKGENSLHLTAVGLSASSQAIEETLTSLLCDEASPAKRKLIIPPLASRIVQDLMIHYGFEQQHKILSTNMGNGIFLKMRSISPFINIVEDQVGTVYIDHPCFLGRKILLKDGNFSGLETLKIDINTPWLEVKRDFHPRGNDVEIEEHVIIKKSFITPEEIRSETYKNMRAKLKKYCKEVALILSQKRKA